MHEFFMTEKDISVRIFSSVVINSARLIFKKGYKNLAKKPQTQETCNSAFLAVMFLWWSVKFLKTFCSTAGASSAALVGFEHPGPDDVCVRKVTVVAAEVKPCFGQAAVNT